MPAMTSPATRDLDDVIARMPATFVECRDTGHSWKPFSVRWLDDIACHEQTHRCRDCKATKTRILNRHGAVMASPRYTHQPGYLVKGHGRFTGADRDALRLAELNHVLGTHQLAVVSA